MKKLIYSNIKAIESHELFANQLINALNTVLNRFKERHNHFGQPIDENFAFTLFADPLKTFDDLLRANSPIKPIANKPLDIEKLAELTGIDRKGFIKDFTIILPGSKNQYNRQGTIALFKLQNEKLVSWSDGSFILSIKQFEIDCERFRVYAITPEQTAIVEYWERLTAILNEHKIRYRMDDFNCHQIADMLHLDLIKGAFSPKYKDIAREVKSLQPAEC